MLKCLDNILQLNGLCLNGGIRRGTRPRASAVDVFDEETAAVTRPEAGAAAHSPPLLTAEPVEVTDAAIREVVRGHTCEAGVRELARQVGAICQFLACRRVETGDSAPVPAIPTM